MAFGLHFPVEFEVMEVTLNSSEGNHAENTHNKKKPRNNVKIGKYWREKSICKIIWKISN